MIVDFIAQVVLGSGSLVAMALLYRHADALSDGNIGGLATSSSDVLEQSPDI